MSHRGHRRSAQHPACPFLRLLPAACCACHAAAAAACTCCRFRARSPTARSRRSCCAGLKGPRRAPSIFIWGNSSGQAGCRHQSSRTTCAVSHGRLFNPVRAYRSAMHTPSSPALAQRNPSSRRKNSRKDHAGHRKWVVGLPEAASGIMSRASICRQRRCSIGSRFELGVPYPRWSDRHPAVCTITTNPAGMF